MPISLPRAVEEVVFDKAARDYLHRLPLEHFMEATAQATQRAITLACLALVLLRRPDFQLFNELLVQYRLPRQRKIRQVVPDNMVVLWHEKIQAEGSYNVPLQPTKPFWVMEYVSKHSKRKDYDDNMVKYEKELKVPYYLLFYPEAQELTLYRHGGRKYHSVKPNANGRYAIPEVDLEVALVDGWVRYWYQGELLPLPAELQRRLDNTQQRLDNTQRQLIAVQRQAEEANHLAQEQARRAEEQARRTEEANRRTEEANRRAEEQARRAEEANRRAEEQAEELTQLRAQLEQQRTRKKNGA